MYRTCRLAIATATAALALTLACALPAHAQLHERSSGLHTVRANVIGSLSLEPSVARRHDIVRARDRAVLNVVVTAGTPLETVPARIEARVASPGAPMRPITMREVVANDGVSYIGTFESPPGRLVHVELAVRPKGATHPIPMRFTDALPPP